MYVNDTGFEPSQSFAYELKGDSAVILRCFSRDTKAEIPEMLDGHLVTELGAYAFSGHMDEKAFEKGIRGGKIKLHIPQMLRIKKLNESGDAAEILVPDAPALAGNALEEIVIPSTVRRIGRYCFYNCARLYKMTFSGTLQDWGAGAFTGVHHVKEMVVTTDGEGKTTLKQVLDELHEEITVTYFDEKGRESRLVFPEYFEEGIENTPARILEEKIHGSGMMYRNCITERRMDFRQYDSLFDHAGFLESRNMTVRLSIGRLQYPTELSDKAREQYEAYVIENAQEAAEQFLRERNLKGIRWLLELYDKVSRNQVTNGMDTEKKTGDISQETGNDYIRQKQAALQSYMMEAAARMQFTEATGFLMNFGHTKKRPTRKRFEL